MCRPELDDFEELFLVDAKAEAKFDKIDAQLLVKDPSSEQRQQKLAIVPDGRLICNCARRKLHLASLFFYI